MSTLNSFGKIGCYLVFAANVAGCAGTAPDNLGVREGRLAACPDSPNCVSSQAIDSEHRVEALSYPGAPESLKAHLFYILKRQAGATVIETAPGYLRAEFSSRILGFVDDVEFWWQSPARIEVRSASRLGYSDFGVNRARVENLRKELKVSASAVPNP